MSLFNGPKNYATLTAPLQKMVEDLKIYMSEMASKIKGLDIEKAHISAEINISKTEIAKSNFTTNKIGEMVITDDDIDEAYINDVTELPDNEWVDDFTPDPSSDDDSDFPSDDDSEPNPDK